MPNEEYLKAFEAELDQKVSQDKTDLLMSYFDIAKIFPGGPHPDSFDYDRVDSKALKQWAEQNNWEVQTAPEATHKDQQNTPKIRFTKKS